MSARKRTLGRRVGTLLVALYPELWRARYAEEMTALLEDDPPDVRGLASLLVGAADAHLRPQGRSRGDVPAVTAMRLSVGALFACWIAVSLAGIGFAKETEGLSPVESAHPLLAAAHGAIFAGAIVGAVSIALGGLPLLWQALRATVRRHDPRLAAMIAAPALAVAAFAVFAGALFLLAPSREGRFPASFVLAVIVPLTLAGLGCAAVCALAPKGAMRLAQPTASALRRAAWAGQALTVAMCLVTGGLLLYVPKLWTVSTAIGAEQSGPFGASVRVTLCLNLAAALVACGLALLAAGRARSAALLAT